MVSKKILGVAIAAAFSSQAFAAVDFDGADAAAQGKKTYAFQSLLTGTGSVASENKFHIVGDGAVDGTGVTNLKTKLGFGVSQGATRFIRVDLTNAVFSTAVVAATHLEVNGAAVAGASVVQGGTVGSTSVILEITAPAGGLAPAQFVELNLPDLGIAPAGGVAIKYALYQDAGNSVNQTSPLYSKELTGVFSVADGYKSGISASTVTADVNTAFTKFVVGAGTDVLQSVGKIDVVVADGVIARNTGAAPALNTMVSMANTKIKVAGDFSVGTWGWSATSACGAQTAATFTSDAKVLTADIDLTTLQAKPFLCVLVDGTKVIPKGDYTATITYAKADTSANGNAGVLAATVATAGTIARNGTTIQVPYLTTFADYAQRLVLVNRGNSDYPYTISFTPEAGVTATAGTAATGTLAKGQTKIIKVTDVVTLTGATRTAGTIVVSAPSGNIDAATTSVNVADKSTDTVKLSSN